MRVMTYEKNVVTYTHIPSRNHISHRSGDFQRTSFVSKDVTCQGIRLAAKAPVRHSSVSVWPYCKLLYVRAKLWMTCETLQAARAAARFGGTTFFVLQCCQWDHA